MCLARKCSLVFNLSLLFMPSRFTAEQCKAITRTTDVAAADLDSVLRLVKRHVLQHGARTKLDAETYAQLDKLFRRWRFYHRNPPWDILYGYEALTLAIYAPRVIRKFSADYPTRHRLLVLALLVMGGQLIDAFPCIYMRQVLTYRFCRCTNAQALQHHRRCLKRERMRAAILEAVECLGADNVDEFRFIYGYGDLCRDVALSPRIIEQRHVLREVLLHAPRRLPVPSLISLIDSFLIHPDVLMHRC